RHGHPGDPALEEGQHLLQAARSFRVTGATKNRASGEARFLVIEDKWTCNQVQQEAALLLPQARRADPARTGSRPRTGRGSPASRTRAKGAASGVGAACVSPLGGAPQTPACRRPCLGIPRRTAGWA